MEQVLIGNGGHAREVMAQMGIKLLRFVDDQYVDNDTLPLSKLDPNKHTAMIAISDTRDRYDIFQRLPKELQFFTYIHPTSLIMDDNITIGKGSFIGAYSVLTTNIIIGEHAILNRANHVGHDTKIGDYFSAMPGAIISGNVRIFDLVYIGTNSSIKEKISIHSFTTIGSNATVVKNIQTSGTFVGVPVKKIK